MKSMKRLLLALAFCFTAAQAQSVQDDLQAAAIAYQRGDLASAFSHLERAAESGNAVAQYNLSVAYSNGDGTAQDVQKALSLLQSSAAQGFPPAVYDLALHHLSQGNAQAAAPLLKSLAEQGDPASQFNYGLMLLGGDGVAQNEAQGRTYIEQSAAQGFPPAVRFLQQ